MTNAIETKQIHNGKLSFDHSSLVMTAHYSDGTKSTWSMKPYGHKEAHRAFLFSAERWAEE